MEPMAGQKRAMWEDEMLGERRQSQRETMELLPETYALEHCQ